MDLRDRMEIYIPAEAKVKRIPLLSLPESVSRRIGLPASASDSNGFMELKDSPECIWISPAVIRSKGQKQTVHTENKVKESMVSLLGRTTQSGSCSYQMSFVSSNCAAYRILKNAMPGKTVAAHAPSTSQLRYGSSPQTHQDAVVIYNGKIYLSIRRPNRSPNQRDTHEPQPASKSCAPSTSDSSSESQKKDQQNDDRIRKECVTSEVEHSENENSGTQTVREVPSSVTAHSAPPSPVRTVDCHEDSRVEQAAEEVQETSWCQPQEDLTSSDGGECEMRDLDSEDAERINDIRVMDRNIHVEYDFQALNDDEELAKRKAKFRAKEVALSNLSSS